MGLKFMKNNIFVRLRKCYERGMTMRLIDAHALIDEMNEMWKIHPAVWENIKILSFDAVIDLIGAAPVIEAKPVVHAHWDEVSGGRIICDHCGEYPLYDYFGRIKLSRCCPTCGALMSNGGHWLFRKAEEYLKENNCGATMDEFASDNNVGGKEEEENG